jgi:hypothetical protein
VWLVAVTALQYISLKLQRQELKLTRQELELTRKEFRDQAEALQDQANSDRNLLQLARQTHFFNQIETGRAIVRHSVIDAIGVMREIEALLGCESFEGRVDDRTRDKDVYRVFFKFASKFKIDVDHCVDAPQLYPVAEKNIDDVILIASLELDGYCKMVQKYVKYLQESGEGLGQGNVYEIALASPSLRTADQAAVIVLECSRRLTDLNNGQRSPA